MEENVFNFLSSGGSKTPLDTIKLLDVDLTQRTLSGSYSICENWIDQFEVVVKQLLKKQNQK